MGDEKFNNVWHANFLGLVNETLNLVFMMLGFGIGLMQKIWNTGVVASAQSLFSPLGWFTPVREKKRKKNML